MTTATTTPMPTSSTTAMPPAIRSGSGPDFFWLCGAPGCVSPAPDAGLDVVRFRLGKPLAGLAGAWVGKGVAGAGGFAKIADCAGLGIADFGGMSALLLIPEPCPVRGELPGAIPLSVGN